MGNANTITRTKEDLEATYDRDVANTAREELAKDSGIFGNAILGFVNWLRTKVKEFLFNNLEQLPVVGKMAARISTTVSEFCFTVLDAMLNLLKLTFTAPNFWKKAHEMAMHAWDDNAINGLIAQTYAYGKKMAGYIMEVIKQCLERAIKAKGLEMSAAEKLEISSTLDELTESVGL